MNLSSAANLMGIPFTDFSDDEDDTDTEAVLTSDNAEAILEEVLADDCDLRTAYNIAYSLDTPTCKRAFDSMVSDAIDNEADLDDFIDQIRTYVLEVFDETTNYLRNNL